MIRSMLVIGSAQAVNIVISIVRMKVLAVLVGPAGLGLFGLYTSLQSTVGTFAGLGLETSGVRDIAANKDDLAVQSRVRTVLFTAGLVQGAIAMVLVWLFRAPLAQWLFGDASRATETGLVGVAILLSLVLASQTAILRGLRRIGDLGRVTVLSALGGTIGGLIAVWLEGEAGLIWFLLVQPLVAVLITAFISRKLPRAVTPRLTSTDAFAAWKSMASLGVVFMIGGLAGAATLLFARSLIARDLGIEAAGLFSASWGVAMTYVGFLLGAMAADFYPRLTEVINDRATSVRLMNDQAQLGLAIGGPVLLALVGIAPWFLAILYSSEFVPAAEMLQWQTVGNVLKLASWPMGFAYIAAARSRIFLATELAWNAAFLGLLWVLMPVIGVEAAGMAFMIAYAMYFILLHVLTRRLFEFRWERLSLTLIAVHTILASLILAVSRQSPILAAGVAVVLAAVTAIAGLRIVVMKIGPHGRLSTRLHAVFSALRRPIRSAK
jgi:O-antigen/teichoic acid export membrane protein